MVVCWGDGHIKDIFGGFYNLVTVQSVLIF